MGAPAPICQIWHSVWQVCFQIYIEKYSTKCAYSDKKTGTKECVPRWTTNKCGLFSRSCDGGGLLSAESFEVFYREIKGSTRKSWIKSQFYQPQINRALICGQLAPFNKGTCHEGSGFRLLATHIVWRHRLIRPFRMEFCS